MHFQNMSIVENFNTIRFFGKYLLNQVRLLNSVKFRYVQHLNVISNHTTYFINTLSKIDEFYPKIIYLLLFFF